MRKATTSRERRCFFMKIKVTKVESLKLTAECVCCPC
jgi:hypothetical protein